MSQLEMFNKDKKYPDVPGFAKNSITSRKAAEQVSQPNKMQQLVINALEAGDKTDYEIADFLGLPMARVQPRRSELFEKGIVIDTGTTRTSPYGREATVWHKVQKCPK